MQYYIRGGASNTDNFDSDSILFKADMTGLYFDANGVTHQITWQFLNNDNTPMTILIQNTSAPTETLSYSNLRYKNGALLFDQYWNYSGINAHAQAIRTPNSIH